MRIALVVPGGVGQDEYRVIPALVWLIERLARRHDVQVVALRQEPQPGSWDLLGARVHNVGIHRQRVKAVRLLLRLHRSKPFDLFHSIWAGAPGEVALLAARWCRRPFLTHVAGGELVRMPDIRFGSRRQWSLALTRFVLHHADRVTAASGPMLDLVRRAGATASRVTLGVDTARWAPTAPRARSLDRPARLVHVGSLTPVKGHATLLTALARLIQAGVPAHLSCVGEDTSGGIVQRYAAELGIAGRVTFHGFLPQRALVSVVRDADLMLVTSRHEAGPVALLEAAAVGVPTVGTAVGHVQDLAPRAAVAVPVGDADALAHAVADLLQDDARRLALARRAQEFALQEDADWTCQRFEELYQEVAVSSFSTKG